MWHQGTEVYKGAKGTKLISVGHFGPLGPLGAFQEVALQ
jgi:hypothetical protein